MTQSELGRKIEEHLLNTGKNIKIFSEETEVAMSTIYRLLTGERQGVHLRTFQRMRPYIGDMEEQEVNE